MSKHHIAVAAVTIAVWSTISAVALAQTATEPTPPNPSPPVAGSPATGSTPVRLPTADLTNTPNLTPIVPISPNIYRAGGGPFAFANPFEGIGRIQTLWTRTELPVLQGLVQRTWLWGPRPNTPGLLERYDDAPNGTGTRLVQYFDKSRMEINDPAANWNNSFYVTNGLLAVELISGAIQVGDRLYLPYRSSCLHVAGDPGNGLTPTYSALARVSNTPFEEHPAPNRMGGTITQTIDVAGNIGNRPDLANEEATRIVHFEGQGRHNIPRVFWDFLNSRGIVYEEQPDDSNRIVNQPNISLQSVVIPWFYATGLPISEPYWTFSIIDGQRSLILVQAYERRILTYNPGNSPGFQVEMGNIGQHYFDWRYRNSALCPGSPRPAPMPIVPVPTGTIPATTPTFRPSTPFATAAASTTPPTPFPIPTGTITPLPTVDPITTPATPPPIPSPSP